MARWMLDINGDSTVKVLAGNEFWTSDLPTQIFCDLQPYLPHSLPVSKIYRCRFPCDPQRREAWVQEIGLKDWIPNKFSRICSDHFEECCYENSVPDMRQRTQVRFLVSTQVNCSIYFGSYLKWLCRKFYWSVSRSIQDLPPQLWCFERIAPKWMFSSDF